MAMLAIHSRRLKTVKPSLYKEFCAIPGALNVKYRQSPTQVYILGMSVNKNREYINWDMYARLLNRAYID